MPFLSNLNDEDGIFKYYRKIPLSHICCLMSLSFGIKLQVKRSASSSESADVQPVDTQVSMT